jgi:hypothetical protein
VSPEIAAAVGFVVLSVGLLVVVRRLVPIETLEQQHEVAGVCFAVLGGLYGIILAFVLVSSWERFEQARAQTELEANAVADLYRHAEGFEEPTRTQLADAVIAYLHDVVGDEWPAMAEGRFSEPTQKRYYDLWDVVLKSRPDPGWEVALYQATIGKLDDLADGRRHRLIYMRTSLPAPVWAFLIVFGIATVGFTYFFGMRSLVAQVVITALLASTIACTLVLVTETQHPFSGAMRVSDAAFRVTLDFIRRHPGVH